MKRRSLGQHYLTDRDVVRRIIAAARVQPGERVLEIGTGKGVLTRELVGLGSEFEGYELDKENWVETLGQVGRMATVHLGDAFRKKPRFDVLVSSLPYSRSADFIEWISQVDYKKAVVLLQEEFVRKILAPPGTREYRAVSVIAQVSSQVEALGRVGRKSFSPPPKVSSLLVSMTPKSRLSGAEISRVKRLFSLRRREVVSALSRLKMGRSDSSYGRRRVYSLGPEEVLDLCRNSV